MEQNVETLKSQLEDMSRAELLDKAQDKLNSMMSGFTALKTPELRKKLLALLKG
jgi:hypothetical protein